ncbi:MAG: LysR family transcriptional regulator [Burkholderiales bacterium]
MDRLAALRVFVRAAELGSFSRVAEQLGLPRASVSAAIAQLEAELGARMFQRTTRKISLTTDGAAMLERGRGLLEDFEAAYTQFRSPSAQVSGRLIVDVPSRIARRLLIPALPELLARHPALELELRADDRLIDLVDEGVDCAVRVGPLGPSTLVARPLGTLAMVGCASPAYLRTHAPLMTVDDLDQHVAVHYDSQRGVGARGEAFWDYVDGKGAPRRKRCESRLSVRTAETYIACAVAGLGLIQVPAFDVADALARGDLVEVLSHARPSPMPVNALYPHRRHLSPRVRAFLNWLQPLFAPIGEGRPKADSY